MKLFDDEYIKKAYGKEMLEEGIETGENRQVKKDALNMHKEGIPLNVIARVVGHAENVVAGWLAEAKA